MKLHSLLILLFFSIVFMDVIGQVDEISERRFTISYGHEELHIPFSSNHSIKLENAAISHVVIVVHGIYRNAKNYFETMKGAAEMANVSADSLLILAPQFLTDKDKRKHGLGEDYLSWSQSGWAKGSLSSKKGRRNTVNRVSSFTVLDSLLVHLTQKFTNLQTITLTGHSGGGQFTQRYVLSSPVLYRLHDNDKYRVKCVVANAGSFTYLSEERPNSDRTGYALPPLSAKCSQYNEWKYGIDGLYNYHADQDLLAMIKRYKKFQITYLVGALDNDPKHENLDRSCSAQLQGAHRLERAQLFYQFLVYFYGEEIAKSQHFHVVPGAAHNSAEVYHSAIGLQELFGWY